MQEKCRKCGHTWIYKGNAIWITCPSCRSLMKNSECSIAIKNDGDKK